MATKISFVGGGQTCLKFVKFLEKVPNFEISIIADQNRDAVAMRYAAEKQMRITTNIIDAVKFPEINCIIETTGGRPDIVDLIKQNISEKVVYINSAQSEMLSAIFSGIINTEFESLEQSFMVNIKNIEKSITDFNNITKNIDILAINASIEAARAGEAGKGFAVVASSIKDLVKSSRDTLQYVKSVLEKLTLIHRDMQKTRVELNQDSQAEE